VSLSFEGAEEVDLLDEEHSHTLGGFQAPVVGSATSDMSNTSVLELDTRSHGSHPSSAETPATRFSEGEEIGRKTFDPDHCDWDTLDEAGVDAADKVSNRLNALATSELDRRAGLANMEDDFPAGLLDEDSAASDRMVGGGSPKGLGYTLRDGGSSRSSFRSHGSTAGTASCGTDKTGAGRPTDSACASETEDSVRTSAAANARRQRNAVSVRGVRILPGALPLSVSPATAAASKKKQKKEPLRR
jgi:hypothetical protein